MAAGATWTTYACMRGYSLEVDLITVHDMMGGMDPFRFGYETSEKGEAVTGFWRRLGERVKGA